MKALNATEVRLIGESIRALVGAHFQEVISSDRLLCVRLYTQAQSHWLVIDMNAPVPVMFVSPVLVALKKKPKPVQLFLRAHFTGAKLESVEDTGSRVLTLHFETGSIEVRLFPHGQNLIVVGNDKTISWSQVAELKPTEIHEQAARTPDEIRAEWSKTKVQKVVPDVKISLARSIEKKKSALLKIQEDINDKVSMKWSEAGEWLKEKQTLQVPDEYLEYIDLKLNLAENIQHCFVKAKDLQRKIESAKLRYLSIKSEIEKLESADSLPNTIPNPDLSLKVSKEKVSSKRLELKEGRLAYLGRSARDNLALLRSAQSWDLWLHLKDYPGAHVIIRRTRGKEVTGEEIEQAAKWLASESQASKRELRKGDFFEVQLAECRFVRPIKGDSLGRVTVSELKVLRFKL